MCRPTMRTNDVGSVSFSRTSTRTSCSRSSAASIAPVGPHPAMITSNMNHPFARSCPTRSPCVPVVRRGRVCTRLADPGSPQVLASTAHGAAPRGLAARQSRSGRVPPVEPGAEGVGDSGIRERGAVVMGTVRVMDAVLGVGEAAGGWCRRILGPGPRPARMTAPVPAARLGVRQGRPRRSVRWRRSWPPEPVSLRRPGRDDRRPAPVSRRTAVRPRPTPGTGRRGRRLPGGPTGTSPRSAGTGRAPPARSPAMRRLRRKSSASDVAIASA